MIVSVLRATWNRWKRISSPDYSLLRGLEYEHIVGLALKGRTLDLGGGQRADYYPLLSIDGRIDSINISAAMGPTLVADLNCPLPLTSASFDNVISMNTLEHIRNDILAVAEMVRVLKPGGHFHITVPFLFRIHGSPNDYHRHSASWWEDLFLSLGLASEDFTIEPLVWDPLSSAYSLMEFGRFHRVVKRLVTLRGVVSHARWPGLDRLDGPREQVYSDFPVGYYISGTKG